MTARYNIYKNQKPLENDLIRKLESVELSPVGSKRLHNFNLTLYLSREPEEIDIWWIDLFAEYVHSLEGTLSANMYETLVLWSLA